MVPWRIMKIQAAEMLVHWCRGGVIGEMVGMALGMDLAMDLGEGLLNKIEDFEFLCAFY
jgi:hypothetical protein